MKEKTYKELKNEQERGKKTYLERLAQDQEAQAEIESFLKEKKEKDTYEGSTPIRNFD